MKKFSAEEWFLTEGIATVITAFNTFSNLKENIEYIILFLVISDKDNKKGKFWLPR